MPDEAGGINSEIPAKNSVPEKSLQSPIQPEQSQPREELFLETPQETILRTNEIEEMKELQGGATKPLFVKIKDDGFGVFKPASREGTVHRRTIKSGTFFKRERAAYLVDKFLVFGLVPPTVIREINGEIGSLQEFIPGTTNFFYYKETAFFREWERYSRMIRNADSDLKKDWVFNYIVFNSDTDAQYHNLLIKDNKKVYAIDNALSFGDDFMFASAQEFYGEPLPKEIRERISKLLSSKNSDMLKNLLSELLRPHEVEACFKRMETVNALLTRHGDKIPHGTKRQLTFD